MFDFFSFLNHTFFSGKLVLNNLIVAERMRLILPDSKQDVKEGLFFNALSLNSKKGLEHSNNFIFVSNKGSYNKIMTIFLHELAHLIELQLYKTRKEKLKIENPNFHSKRFYEIENSLSEMFLCLKYQMLGAKK